MKKKKHSGEVWKMLAAFSQSYQCFGVATAALIQKITAELFKSDVV